MATKNIVPRGNNEGQLGTDSKKWNKHIAVTGSFTTISGSISGNELTLVSGSAKSTGSFGKVLGDGSQLTGVTATASPAGLNTYVQFNDDDSTGGDAGFTYDKTANSITTITHITASGNISSSITSTGSFGHIMKSGVNWDTAVSASAASEGFGSGGGGSSFTAAGISGSWQSYSLISGSAQIKTQISGSLGANASVIRGLTNVRISGSFTSTSSSLASRITTREAFITQSFSDGTATLISGSSTSTGSFGHILKGGVNWDTAVSASAATAGFGVGGGSSFTAAGISGSWQSYSLISGSAQIKTQISGAFTSTSSSLASRVTTNEGYLNQSVKITDDVTFASITTTGDITARNYIVSSSVTYMTSSFSSGSTIFGDDITDTHLFTGSLFVSGNLTAVNLTADSSSFSSRITTAELELGNTLISSSAQIATQISGSVTAVSSSFASRITTAELELGNTLISSSAQIASAISGSLGTNASIIRGLTNVSISGSFTSVSASLASRLDAEESDSDFTSAGISGSLGTNASVIRGLTSVSISGSFTGVSSSLASRITTEESNVDSLQTDSGSFSTRLTTAETELGNTLISSSAQIASNISGSFTTVSSSLASRIETREAFITQSFSDGTATLISGSASSTGSFGHILKGGVNWDTAVSSSAATAGFGTGGGGGGSSFTSAGISGSFTSTSGSFSTRVTDLENPESVTADFGGYTFSTSSAQTTWNITHNLNSQYPNVTVYDSSDEVIIPNSITANTISSSTIVFTSPVSGKAHYSVGGNMSGSADSTGSFGHIQVVGDFLPTADNSSDLGSSTKRFANIHSADIQLSNEGTEGNEVDGTTGNWTIQEGEDDLYLLNRKNGKKYRFKLDEIK